MRTISFQVTNKTYERLAQLKIYNRSWREFWMLCAIRHCQKILAGGGGRRGIKHYRDDIFLFQKEIQR